MTVEEALERVVGPGSGHVVVYRNRLGTVTAAVIDGSFARRTADKLIDAMPETGPHIADAPGAGEAVVRLARQLAEAAEQKREK